MRYSVCLLLIAFGLLAGCQSFFDRDAETAALHLELWTSQMMEGRYPEALSSLLEAERLDPDNPVIQNNLGLTYLFRQRFDLAEKKVRHALAIKPDYSDARNNLSSILIEKGQYQEASDEAYKVTQDLTYSSPEKAFVNHGIANFRLGRFDVARNSLRSAIEFQRDNCLAHTYFGRTYFEQKDYERAAQSLDRAVGFCLKSQYDEPHYYSALSYYQLGFKKKSEARFEELLKLYPQGKFVDKSKEMLQLIRR